MHRRLKFGPSILLEYLKLDSHLKKMVRLLLMNAGMAYSAHRGWTLEVA